MFLDLEWYWWGLIVVIMVVSIPLKIKCIKWWNVRRGEKNVRKIDKWGGEE